MTLINNVLETNCIVCNAFRAAPLTQICCCFADLTEIGSINDK